MISDIVEMDETGRDKLTIKQTPNSGKNVEHSLLVGVKSGTDTL